MNRFNRTQNVPYYILGPIIDILCLLISEKEDLGMKFGELKF